jgi:hypothetical protein
VVSGASLAATAGKVVIAVAAVAVEPMEGGGATAAVRLRARWPPDRRRHPMTVNNGEKRLTAKSPT